MFVQLFQNHCWRGLFLPLWTVCHSWNSSDYKREDSFPDAQFYLLDLSGHPCACTTPPKPLPSFVTTLLDYFCRTFAISHEGESPMGWISRSLESCFSHLLSNVTSNISFQSHVAMPPTWSSSCGDQQGRFSVGTGAEDPSTSGRLWGPGPHASWCPSPQDTDGGHRGHLVFLGFFKCPNVPKCLVFLELFKL